VSNEPKRLTFEQLLADEVNQTPSLINEVDFVIAV
jgi:hypothetical protein